MSIEERCPRAYSKIEKYVNTEDFGASRLASEVS